MGLEIVLLHAEESVMPPYRFPKQCFSQQYRWLIICWFLIISKEEAWSFNPHVVQLVLVVPQKLINVPWTVQLKCTVHFAQRLQVMTLHVRADSLPARGRCLPGAVEECHPSGASPGRGWRVEPKRRGAFAVCPSLEAIITAMVQAEKNKQLRPDEMQLFLRLENIYFYNETRTEFYV